MSTERASQANRIKNAEAAIGRVTEDLIALWELEDRIPIEEARLKHEIAEARQVLRVEKVQMERLKDAG